MKTRWKLALGGIVVAFAALWHKHVVKRERARATDTERKRQKAA